MNCTPSITIRWRRSSKRPSIRRRPRRIFSNVLLKRLSPESVLTILPALKSGKWPLLNEDLSPALQHKPAMPLTILEKRWLKAIAEDPRVKLFDIEFPALDDVPPLFTHEDYKIYDSTRMAIPLRTRRISSTSDCFFPL